MSKRGKNWQSVHVECPYFRYFIESGIACEPSIEGAQTTSTRFRGEKELKYHRENFCYSPFWKSCPHAASVSEKYK